MKKYFISIALVALVAACSNSSSGNKGNDSAAASVGPAASDASNNPDYKKGLALVAANDCLTCHKVDEKVTGPAYRDVANKYDNTPENITKLANKIIAGGSGVWGDAAMTPHPALAQADAEQMVKYILLLKNK